MKVLCLELGLLHSSLLSEIALVLLRLRGRGGEGEPSSLESSTEREGGRRERAVSSSSHCAHSHGQRSARHAGTAVKRCTYLRSVSFLPTGGSPSAVRDAIR